MIVAAVAIAFVAGLFSNPPYGFSLEDNLAYRDYIVMHAEASRFLAMRYPGVRVSDCMARVGRTHPAVARLCEAIAFPRVAH